MSIPTEVPVLVAGGGPAGMLLALQLAKHGIRCMLIERNEDTTKWPKMDITNSRSMELFNRLGVSEGLREIGVPANYSFDVLFSSGLSEGGRKLAKWDLPSPQQWRDRIQKQNDGSMPREPYQRCSQALFEAWLKPRIQQEPLIESHFGVKFESFKESESGVESQITDLKTGATHTVRSQFVAGCDGAGSRVRREAGIKLVGGPVPGAMLLVHFKSKDLTRLHKQGQFWHIFFTSGAVIISQDEIDTWTTHLPIPLDADWESMDPEKAIYDTLGGSLAPFPIKVDKVLVKSVWRPNICVAETFASDSRRIFLAGDAAHQNIPTGGYGMNTAVGDSFDLGWKLAAVLKGHGGKHLLDSYEVERKPVAIRNIDRSGEHWSVHGAYVGWIAEAGPAILTSTSEEAQELRKKIETHVLARDGENQDHGIEMGYRYTDSPVIVADEGGKEPEWSFRNYIPSTWPGARPPHMFLNDNKTSIFDLFGRDYTIVDFSSDGAMSNTFVDVAKTLNVPITRLHFPEEAHARSIWGREAVLVRPDDHVAWRSQQDKVPSAADVERALKVATGQLSVVAATSGKLDAMERVLANGFTGTVGNENQDQVKMRAAFQT